MTIDRISGRGAEQARQTPRRSLEDFESDVENEGLESLQDKRRCVRKERISSPPSPEYSASPTSKIPLEQTVQRRSHRNAYPHNRFPPLYVLAILNRIYLKSRYTYQSHWWADDMPQMNLNELAMKVRLLSTLYQEFPSLAISSDVASTKEAENRCTAIDGLIQISSLPTTRALPSRAPPNQLSSSLHRPPSIPSAQTKVNRYEIFDNEDGYFDNEPGSIFDCDESEDEDNEEDGEEDEDAGTGSPDTKAQRTRYRRTKAVVYSDFNNIQL